VHCATPLIRDAVVTFVPRVGDRSEAPADDP
jgi:hypothetical protein